MLRGILSVNFILLLFSSSVAGTELKSDSAVVTETIVTKDINGFVQELRAGEVVRIIRQDDGSALVREELIGNTELWVPIEKLIPTHVFHRIHSWNRSCKYGIYNGDCNDEYRLEADGTYERVYWCAGDEVPLRAKGHLYGYKKYVIGRQIPNQIPNGEEVGFVLDDCYP